MVLVLVLTWRICRRVSNPAAGSLASVRGLGAFNTLAFGFKLGAASGKCAGGPSPIISAQGLSTVTGPLGMKPVHRIVVCTATKGPLEPETCQWNSCIPVR